MLVEQLVVAELVLEKLNGLAVAHLLLEPGLSLGGNLFYAYDCDFGLDIVDVIGDDVVFKLPLPEELLLGGQLQVLDQLLQELQAKVLELAEHRLSELQVPEGPRQRLLLRFALLLLQDYGRVLVLNDLVQLLALIAILILLLHLQDRKLQVGALSGR